MQICAINIVMFAVMCVISYVSFFIEQLDWVLVHSTKGVWADNKTFLFLIALVILTMVYSFESMKMLSYISMVSLTMLFIGLSIVMFSASSNLTDPAYDKNIKLSSPTGSIYFFGTVLFAFEGNPVILEIRH